MTKRSHLKFLSKRQLSEIKDFKYNYGFDNIKDEKDDAPKNYFKQASLFRDNLQKFNKDLEEKSRKKDRTLEIPYDIDYVQITFQGQFVISKYFQQYYNSFGLEGTLFSDFGKTGLFAVADRDLFETFIKSVQNFVDYELNGNHAVEYSSYIKYISGFKLLTSKDIIRFGLDNIGDIVYLSLINLPLDLSIKQEIVNSLIEYLNINSLLYIYDEENDRIELHNPNQELIKKITQNFDIIESVTCSAFTTVRPSEFNTVERQFGFTIRNAEEDLPIVGIIDTGISVATALAPLIIDDVTFTLAGNPLVDLAGRRSGLHYLGHGTAVAALVALGKQNHKNNFEGEVVADAKLLSIKISDNGNGYMSEVNLLKMLYDVKIKYPNLRLFTLTTCYRDSMHINEAFSDYTYALDKFAYETNSLIFICTGNNDNCINENSNYDLSYFQNPQTNLSTPADSLNNITVGAAADNLIEGPFMGISSSKEFPSLYTRRGHIDLSSVYGPKKRNKNYFKPDVIESGGDMGYFDENALDWLDEPALKLLSARPEIGTMQDVGTSFATPLVANLAAKIVKNYPSLSNETVKALIINGASHDLIPFPADISHLKSRIIGNGLINEFKSLYSDANSATLILEDIVGNGKIRIYPINFPSYLVRDDLAKAKKRLKITATLCFKFLPIKNNQLSYNPIHMAFSIFKNHSAEDIMKADDKETKFTSKLRSTLSWSQNGRFVAQPTPYSNTQKITLNVNVEDLNNEANTFKLAIHAKLTEQIIGGLPENYPTDFPFSIVLHIEETLKDKTGKLYDEIEAINYLEAIQDVQLDTVIESDILNV